MDVDKVEEDFITVKEHCRKVKQSLFLGFNDDWDLINKVHHAYSQYYPKKGFISKLKANRAALSAVQATVNQSFRIELVKETHTKQKYKQKSSKMKLPQCSRQCVGLLGVKSGFEPQSKHQNKIQKSVKILRVNKIGMKSFDFKLQVLPLMYKINTHNISGVRNQVNNPD